MQERRTTIRVNHRTPAQYCPSEELLPRDGFLANLSERGAGILARESHWEGERITVNMSFPGESEMVTVTGVVRWSTPKPGKGRWYPAGLEWLPLDEATRDRLHRFVSRATASPAGRAPIAQRSVGQRSALTWSLSLGAGLVLIAAGVMAYLWGRSLQEENRGLEAVVRQRNAIIAQLHQNDTRLHRELETAKEHLASTTAEVARLDQQAQALGNNVQRLNEDVDRVQTSYAQVREERDALMQHVLDLEQERLILSRKLSSLPELRVAIREAIEDRKRAQGQWYARWFRAQEQADRSTIEGNRGYLIQDGQPTNPHSTLWIRVHEPESLVSQ